MASKVRCEHLSCTLLRCPHPAPLHTRLAPAVEQRGEVHVEHIPTELNAADVLTKPISRELFDRHCATLMGEGRAST